jgi:hypothetical protein
VAQYDEVFPLANRRKTTFEGKTRTARVGDRREAITHVRSLDSSLGAPDFNAIEQDQEALGRSGAHGPSVDDEATAGREFDPVAKAIDSDVIATQR